MDCSGNIHYCRAARVFGKLVVADSCEMQVYMVSDEMNFRVTVRNRSNRGMIPAYEPSVESNSMKSSLIS